MNYKIELSQQEVQLIYQALGELPMKMVLNLFGKIQQEVLKQDTSKAVPIQSLDLGGGVDPDIEHALTGKP
jgi:hypothetical protein